MDESTHAEISPSRSPLISDSSGSRELWEPRESINSQEKFQLDLSELQ